MTPIPPRPDDDTDAGLGWRDLLETLGQATALGVVVYAAVALVISL